MRRREAVGVAGALGVLGTGFVLSSDRLDGWVRENVIDETTLETLEAAGSEPGETVVPVSGSVTFVDFFATWCTDCEQYMDVLRRLHDRTPDDVQFASVSTEAVGEGVSRRDVAGWFTVNRGNWTVAVDPDLRLAEPMGATFVPHSFVLDESNRIVWSDSGLHDVDELSGALTEAGVEVA